MAYIYRAPLPAEWFMVYQHQKSKLIYTPDEWERDVNRIVGYVRWSSGKPLPLELFNKFCEFLKNEWEYNNIRLHQMEERCQIDSASEWIEPFVKPKGVCYWVDDDWVLIDY